MGLETVLFGINTGLRFGDLLSLKVSDLKRKKKIIIPEGKIKKPRMINITNIYEEVQESNDSYNFRFINYHFSYCLKLSIRQSSIILKITIRSENKKESWPYK